MPTAGRPARQPVRRRRPRRCGCCPPWRRACARSASRFHVERHASLAPRARARARGRRRPARCAVRARGDGLVGAVAGALRGRPAPSWASCPAGAATTSRACSGIPLDAVAACDVLAHGASAPIDLGEVDGRTFVGIASLGFDSDANRIANEAPPRLGRARLRLRRAAGARSPGSPRASTVAVDGDDARFTRLDASPRPTRRPTVAGCTSRPTPGSTTALLDVVLIGERLARRTSSRMLPKVFKGTHVDDADGRASCAAREVRIERRPPVHRLRRRRPDRRAARHRARVPGALRVLLPA